MAIPGTYSIIFHVNSYFNHLLGILKEYTIKTLLCAIWTQLIFETLFAYLKVVPDCISTAIVTSALTAYKMSSCLTNVT